MWWDNVKPANLCSYSLSYSNLKFPINSTSSDEAFRSLCVVNSKICGVFFVKQIGVLRNLACSRRSDMYSALFANHRMFCNVRKCYQVNFCSAQAVFSLSQQYGCLPLTTGCFGDFRRFNKDNSSTRGPDGSRPSELVSVGVSESLFLSLELDVICVRAV